MQLGRELSEREEGGVDFVDERGVSLGFGFDALPFWIIAEGLPVGGSGFARRMLEHVDQRVSLLRIVGGQPVRDILETVLFEKLHGVVTKSRQQRLEFALVSVIDAQFVDGRGGLRQSRERLREKSSSRQRLEQLAAFHGRGL